MAGGRRSPNMARARAGSRVLAPAQRRRTAADLVGRDILDMRRDVPEMAKRIDNRAKPVTVELVLDRPLQRRTGGDGFLRDRVDILEIDMQPDRRAADCRWRERAHFGMLVGQHNETVADLE